MTLLAGQAAIAVENVRLYEAATHWSERLESLNEIGNALATETELDPLLELIARRLRELLEARLVTVLLPSGPDELRFAAAAGEGERRSPGRDSQPVGIEERPGARRGTKRTGRLRARRSRGRSDRHAPPRRPGRPLGSPPCRWSLDRRPRGARQARASGRSLQRRGPSSRRDVREPCCGRRRPLRAGRARCSSARRRGPGARAPAARTRAPRRDRPGADLDHARSA